MLNWRCQADEYVQSCEPILALIADGDGALLGAEIVSQPGRVFATTMRAMKFTILALAGAFLLSACSSDVGGIVAGTGAGALVGSRSRPVLDEQDRKRAYAAEIQALETGPSGVPVPWRNPDSGRYGSVVPGPSYFSNGFPCRQFMETVYLDGRPQNGRWVACRNADGTWFID